MSSFAAQFRILVRDYERLKAKELEEIDCWCELEAFHRKMEPFLEGLRQWNVAMEQDLQGRRHLQQLVQETDWDTDALQLFWDDQLRFYDTWINKWVEQMEPEGPRAIVSMTIKQLLVLLRIARDVGVLQDAPLKHAFVFITAHFRTPQQEQISYESIRKKYSQLDTVAIVEVEDLLYKSLDKLAEYKRKIYSK